MTWGGGRGAEGGARGGGGSRSGGGGGDGVAWRDLKWSFRWCGCDELKNDGGKGGVDVELVVV